MCTNTDGRIIYCIRQVNEQVFHFIGIIAQGMPIIKRNGYINNRAAQIRVSANESLSNPETILYKFWSSLAKNPKDVLMAC